MQVRSYIVGFLMIAGIPWLLTMVLVGPLFVPLSAMSEGGIGAYFDPTFAWISGAIWLVVALPIVIHLHYEASLRRDNGRRCNACGCDLRFAPDGSCPRCAGRRFRRVDGRLHT